MLLGLGEFTHAKSLGEFLAQINICDHHCSFHSKSLLKVSGSFLDQTSSSYRLDSSSFRTSFRRCLTLNDILPSFSYLAVLLVQQLILVWANMILHFTKFRKTLKRSSIQSFLGLEILCETGVSSYPQETQCLWGCSVPLWVLTHCFLVCSSPFPDLGLAVLSAGLLRAHSLNFPLS